MKKKNELMVINEQPITANDIFAAMDGVIANLYQTNDIAKAVYVLMALSKLDEVVGHSKAKLLYGMREWWNETGQTDKRNMEFSDFLL